MDGAGLVPHVVLDSKQEKKRFYNTWFFAVSLNKISEKHLAFLFLIYIGNDILSEF